MSDKPNPHLGRPLKQLIPEWLALSDEYKSLDKQHTELNERMNRNYHERSNIAEAIKQGAAKNQVFLLADGRAVTVNTYGVELVTTTELVATIKRT